MTSASHEQSLALDLEPLVEAMFVHDDRDEAEELSKWIDGHRGNAYVADRVRALSMMLDRLGEALRSAAERRDATDAVIEEYARFQARLAAYGAPSKRAEPAWCLLNDYGWSWPRLLLLDGPTLLEAWDSAARERGEAPMRRLREGGARHGQGRRPGPVVHEALVTSVTELADLLGARRIVLTQDRERLRQLVIKAQALQVAHRLPLDPMDWVAALVRWSARWLFIAAHLADPAFTATRVGRDPQAPFRRAARAGAESPEWLAAIDALAFRDAEVINALGSAGGRRDGDAAGRGGPLAAAAVAIEKVTGMSASAIERHRRARARRSDFWSPRGPRPSTANSRPP